MVEMLGHSQPKGRATGNPNLDLTRRASPRPYRRRYRPPADLRAFGKLTFTGTSYGPRGRSASYSPERAIAKPPAYHSGNRSTAKRASMGARRQGSTCSIFVILSAAPSVLGSSATSRHLNGAPPCLLATIGESPAPGLHLRVAASRVRTTDEERCLWPWSSTS
jgi:hypothetical protein